MLFHLFTGVFRTGFISENSNTGITGRYLPVFKTLICRVKRNIIESGAINCDP
ncbi:hypothetical protein HanRHA438_Chr15g0729951 [Helianthus annuus]|nr:hypothetical protein HanRHA438_Chr15g0729951 [Helianthus annuus]